MATQMKDEIGHVPQPVRQRLPKAAKSMIMQMFASFQSHSDILKAVNSQYNAGLQDRDIRNYDPTRPNARIGPALRAEFETYRAAFIENVAHHGVAHQAKRLQLLERVIEKATTARDFGNAIRGLELAAKEMGGTLTNVATVKHEGKVEHRHLTIDDAKAELAMRLASVIEGGTLTALPSPDTAPNMVEHEPQGDGDTG